MDIAVENDLWIVSDEIGCLNGLGRLASRFSIVNSRREGEDYCGQWVVKVLGYDRMRRFSHGPSEAMRAAVKSQANSASHIPTFMMDAAKVALECEDSVQEFNNEYRKRRKLMTEGLSSIPGIWSRTRGAYVFADVTGTGMTDIEFADGVLEQVQLIPSVSDYRRRGFRQDLICC